MMKIKKEAKVGVTVVLSLALLIWGINFLKGIDMFSSSRLFYATYKHVGGLSGSSPIMLNGLKVGSVKGINFHPSYDGSIVVQFSIEEDELMLPENTVAKIISLDLLGSKSISLMLPGGNIKSYHEVGDTLKSSTELSLSEEVNAQIAPLKLKAEDLISDMDTAVAFIKVIFNQKSDLSASFSSIRSTFETFDTWAKRMDKMTAEESVKLSKMLTDWKSISGNIRNNNENITAILDNVRLISDSLAMSNLTTAVNNASVALTAAARIMDKIDKGEGSVGQLINNDSLHANMVESLNHLDRLLIDIETHPKRYLHFSVFGGKDSRAKEEKKKKKKNR